MNSSGKVFSPWGGGGGGRGGGGLYLLISGVLAWIESL